MKGKQQNETRLPDELAVLLGRFNLARVELDSVQVGVKEIRIHPEWRAFTDAYDADITILVLKKEVEFSHFIQMVCLPKDESIGNNYDGVLVINCLIGLSIINYKFCSRSAGANLSFPMANGMKTSQDKFLSRLSAVLHATLLIQKSQPLHR